MTTPDSVTGLQPGDIAPGFTLTATNGERFSLPAAGEVPASVVIWTCNHCPYAIGWHERLIELARDYRERGVAFFLINSNDSDRYPGDSPEAMRTRVENDGGWPAPYLHDATQEVARAYGALTTPDVYVIDTEGKVAYRGAPDGDYQDDSQNAAWVREALDAVLSGQVPARQLTKPVGCSIKWKE